MLPAAKKAVAVRDYSDSRPWSWHANFSLGSSDFGGWPGVTSIAGAAAVSADGASVPGSGTLTAAGDGIAAPSDSGNVTITRNVILWVRDFQGSATTGVPFQQAHPSARLPGPRTSRPPAHG